MLLIDADDGDGLMLEKRIGEEEKKIFSGPVQPAYINLQRARNGSSSLHQNPSRGAISGVLKPFMELLLGARVPRYLDPFSRGGAGGVHSA